MYLGKEISVRYGLNLKSAIIEVMGHVFESIKTIQSGGLSVLNIEIEILCQIFSFRKFC